MMADVWTGASSWRSRTCLKPLAGPGLVVLFQFLQYHLFVIHVLFTGNRIVMHSRGKRLQTEPSLH